MPLKAYVDIVMNGEAADITTQVVANQVMPILHAAFKRNSGVFALALPQCLPGKKSSSGNTLRIFSSSADDLLGLCNAVKSHYLFRDYCTIKTTNEVPADFCGPWVEYRRYRPSNKNADRKGGDDNGMLRARRMAYAEDHRLPYFVLTSGSNKHGFSLYVEPLAGEACGAQSIEPDSYGLSVTSRSFSVPQLP